MIRDLYFESVYRVTLHRNSDFVLKGTNSTYLYYGDFFFEMDKLTKRALCDTLYLLENNRLIPELKLKFKNDGIGTPIHLTNIYRSSRYVFAVYMNRNEKNFYTFCYNTKTEKWYHTQDFIDDINQIEKPVHVRPFNLDTEMFYYLHTNMKPDDHEEPNPTLYIGRLKK